MLGRAVHAAAVLATAGKSYAKIPHDYDEAIKSSVEVEYDESGEHLLSICQTVSLSNAHESSTGSQDEADDDVQTVEAYL